MSSRIFTFTAILLLPLTARATLNFTKITYNANPASTFPSTDVTASIGDPGQPPALVVSQGLGSNSDPAGNPPTSMQRVVTLTQDPNARAYAVQYHETNLEFFPTHAFFDVFIDISQPTADGDPTSTPSSFQSTPNLGSSGQDGFTLAGDLRDPDAAPTDFFPILFTFTIPEGQTLFFEDVSPVFHPDPDDPGLTSSFFDVYLEIQVTPGSSFDPNLPMFQITTSLDTPEPATATLLLSAGPLLLKRRRRA